jgi:tripartite-type tricarboxylate transporter receptor subunit TctC
MTGALRFGLAAAVVSLAAALGSVHAAPAEDFYKGKQVTLVLSTDVGGGYAASVNLIMPYLSAHIPGKPRIIMQNMPGAGGVRAMNYMFAAAPKDGTRIAMVQSMSPYAPLFGVEAARYDPRRMNWIGSLESSPGICIAWSTSGIRTWQDVFDKEFVVGASGAGSQMETLPLMVNKLFGTKIKVVSGYKGGNEVFLAMERGEVHGRCGSFYSTLTISRPDWIQQKRFEIPFQITLERDPEFPNVPALGEFAKDTRTRQVVELIGAHMLMDRPIVAPPGVPPERIAILRRAFQAAMADPAFIAESQKQRLDIDPLSGQQVADILSKAYAMPADVVSAAREAINLTGSGAN